MGLKEKFKVVFVLAFVLALTWFIGPFFFAPKCTTDIVTTNAALNRSYDELDAAKNAERSVLCNAYLHHIDVLEAVAPVARICGPGQMTRRGLWPHPEAELEFYRHLAAGPACGSAAE